MRRKRPDHGSQSKQFRDSVFALESCFPSHQDLRVLENITVKKKKNSKETKEMNKIPALRGDKSNKSFKEKAANREISCFC